MELVYVLPFASHRHSAVTTKAINHIESLRRKGLNTNGRFFCSYLESECVFSENIIGIPVPDTKVKWFRKPFQNALTYRFILNYLRKNTSDNQVLYMRYSGASYKCYKLSRHFNKRIIFEFQTKEVEEIKINKSARRKFLDISALLTNIEIYYIPLIQDFLFGRAIRKNAMVLAGVTNEICQYQTNNYNLDQRTILVSNSINTRDFKPRQYTPGNKFVLLFLRGASTNAVYHGLDRLIKGLGKAGHELKSDFRIVCIGNNFDIEKKLVSDLGLESHFEFLGYMKANELDHYYDMADMGIGTLALHRINLKEGSVLKVREYYARGLPFIYGYEDSDISSNAQLSEFCLKLSADDSPVDIKILRDFILKIRNDKNHPVTMHEYAEKYLDFDVKAEKFIKDLAAA